MQKKMKKIVKKTKIVKTAKTNLVEKEVKRKVLERVVDQFDVERQEVLQGNLRAHPELEEESNHTGSF